MGFTNMPLVRKEDKMKDKNNAKKIKRQVILLSFFYRGTKATGLHPNRYCQPG